MPFEIVKQIYNTSHLEVPYEPDVESYLCYLFNMGSTEGNIHDIWSARSYLSGDPIKSDTSLSLVPGMQPFCYDDNSNAFSPVAFYSDSSHHGMKRNLHIAAVSSFYDVGIRQYPTDNPLEGPWPTRVPCTNSYCPILKI